MIKSKQHIPSQSMQTKSSTFIFQGSMLFCILDD